MSTKKLVEPKMFRIFVMVLGVYVSGSPAFDGARPEPLDRALRAFHSDVDDLSRSALYNIKGGQFSAPSVIANNYRRSVEPFIANVTR